VIVRTLIAVAFVAAVLVAYLLWRRPPRRLARSTLATVGVREPALVEFVTEGCPPCRDVAPRLRTAAADAHVPFHQIDVGQRPELARAFGIRSVPTVAVTGAGGRVLDVWTAIPPDGEVADAARRARANRG
jgi:thioredoxin-like negative regulator of GroEL